MKRSVFKLSNDVVSTRIYVPKSLRKFVHTKKRKGGITTLDISREMYKRNLLIDIMRNMFKNSKAR